MSTTVFSCLLKSKDGGQTFCYVQRDPLTSLKEKLNFHTTSVKVNRIPNGPILEAWADIASDPSLEGPYRSLHKKYMQYSGLKPRWIYANFRPEHVLSNFTVPKDLLLSNVIQNRAYGQSTCAMIIDQKLGGFYVDYNLYPLIINHNAGIVQNFRWIEYVYFLMQMWLLGSQHNASIDYYVFINYSDNYGDLPVEIEYSIQFKADSNKNEEFIFNLFKHLSQFCREPPINLQQFYMCARDINNMKQELEKIKCLTFERLLLEELVSSIIIDDTNFLHHDKILKEIQAKWDEIRKLVAHVGGKSSNHLQSKDGYVDYPGRGYNSRNTHSRNSPRPEKSELNDSRKINSMDNRSVTSTNEIDILESSFDVANYCYPRRTANSPNRQQTRNSGPNKNNSKPYTGEYMQGKAQDKYTRTRQKSAKKSSRIPDESKYVSHLDNTVSSSRNLEENDEPSPTTESFIGDCKDSAGWGNDENDAYFSNNENKSLNSHGSKGSPTDSAFGDCKDPSSWGNDDNDESFPNKNKSLNSHGSKGSPTEAAFGDCKDPSGWGDDDNDPPLRNNENNSFNKNTSLRSNDTHYNKGFSGNNNVEIESDSSTSVVSEAKINSRTPESSKIRRNRREKDKSRNVIIHGLEFDSVVEVPSLVRDFFKDVLRLEIEVRRVVLVGPEEKKMISVQLQCQEDRDSVLSSSQKILRQLRSRISIREDLSFADRQARKNRYKPENEK